MQTQRLVGLNCPATIEQLLESYILTTQRLTPDASKERDLDRIPPRLRDAASRALDEGCVWTAWCNDFDAWLFIAALSLDRSRELGRPVLEIQRHQLYERSPSRIIAARLPDGSWCQYSE